MTITSGQIKRIHGLLAKAKLMNYKKGILAREYRVTSTKDLSRDQAQDMIDWLDSKIKYENLKPHQWAMFDYKNRQHMKLLSLAIEYGWFVYSEKYGRNVADIERLGGWIMHRAKVRKPLLKQTENELHTTIYQLEQVVRKHYKQK